MLASTNRSEGDGKSGTEIDPPAEKVKPSRPTRLSRPVSVTRQINWHYLSGFIVLHLLVLLAFVPWLFSWPGVVSVFVGNYIFGSLGINLAYHRMLTHRGLTVPKWFEHALALLGVCCLQDAPARWIAIHRMHHQHSDEQPDPHSPLVVRGPDDKGAIGMRCTTCHQSANYEPSGVPGHPLWHVAPKSMAWQTKSIQQP
jgi:hypothetical protein